MKVNFSKSIGLVIGLLLFLTIILFFDLDPANKNVTITAGIALLMAVWWITEAIPLAVTALLPVVLFPLFGIMNGKDVSVQYFNHVIFLFIGGFIVALAMQRWDLHKRIALATLMVFGVKPRQILFGFMLTTAVLSMWISNTATAMMMVPIALSVIINLEQNHDKKIINKYAIGLLLGVAYSASIGGIATLVGTPPNLVLVKIFSISFPEAPEIAFTNWFIFALPLSLFFLVISWLFLSLIFCKGKFNIEKSLLKEQYRALGKMSFEEKAILIVFTLLVLSWLTRANIQIGSFSFKGWSNLFNKPKYINDGTVAVFYAIILFFIPSTKSSRIMVWKDTKDLPWNIVLLFGGGFALAYGFQQSGLSGWVGSQLSSLKNLTPVLLVGSISFFVMLLTELTSNTATTQMILPILAPLSLSIMKNPLLLMVPATIASSIAFMMPVATPPNAIVFGTNRIKIIDMVKYGFILNLIGVVLATVSILLLGGILGINMSQMPVWAK
ncbi:MAG: SLC13/DASS family transporter [Chlorobi bacterium]|nr:SLC13/DASS family transporter [Chlorobiota bacterium]